MSSSAFGPGDSSGRTRSGEPSEQNRQRTASDSIPDPGLLEEVLQETLASSPAGGIPRDELRALLNVAQRYKGQPLTQEPVATELVLSILQSRFGQLKVEAEQWRTMSHQIAGTLMDDEHSAQRLLTFWRRLVEALP
jgi:hypothetical protein